MRQIPRHCPSGSARNHIGDQSAPEKPLQGIQKQRKKRERDHQTEDAESIQPRRCDRLSARGKEKARITVYLDHPETERHDPHIKQNDFPDLRIGREKSNNIRHDEKIKDPYCKQIQKCKVHGEIQALTDPRIAFSSVILPDHRNKRNSERHREDERQHLKPSGGCCTRNRRSSEFRRDTGDHKDSDRHHQHPDRAGDRIFCDESPRAADQTPRKTVQNEEVMSLVQNDQDRDCGNQL